MTTAIQYGSKSRFTDLYNEPVDYLLSPIKGYQNEPLVSLTEAIEPVARLFNEIKDNIFVALHNCQSPSDGLTQEESASIHLYTMPFDGGPSLYRLLNQSLRAANRQELKPWLSFLKLFLTALHKLPSQRRTKIWRGIRDVDLSSKYKTGKKFAWWGVSSCTVDKAFIESNQVVGTQGQRTLFSIECINGKSVAEHSYFKNAEQEMILMPGTYFEVIDQLNPTPELHIIQLKEITPTFTLVKPPFFKSNELESPFIAYKSSSFSPSAPTMITKMTPPESFSNKRPSITSVNPNIPVDASVGHNNAAVAGGRGYGDATNQLKRPRGLFFDDNQTIVIADLYNHRIVQWKIGDMNGQVVAGGHGQGNRLDQLDGPTDVLIDQETDSLIICDAGNGRVVRWLRRNDITEGEILLDNIRCCGLAMDDQRNLYISDIEKHEVRRYPMGDKKGVLVAGGHGRGSGFNQLNEPSCLFVDRQQAVYVSDSQNHRVMKWNKGAKKGIVVAGGQGSGNALKQLSYPSGLVIDTLSNIYVADAGNHRVMRWLNGAEQGIAIVDGSNQRHEATQLNWPMGLCFDRNGYLYVADNGNNRVQRFSIKWTH